MKTANCCFPTGVTAYEHEPLFTADMLVYGGRYYLIGEGHKEFAPDKINDEDYYVLTLAAIAKELKAENLNRGAHCDCRRSAPDLDKRTKSGLQGDLMKNAEVRLKYAAMNLKKIAIWKRNASIFAFYIMIFAPFNDKTPVLMF